MTPHGNPFPGLRPFESNESSLFFGRDDQCDELLARLARRRLVAVVGASGSGKSSLVRAGLLPALQRGYLPSAGSSWQIAVFRPGGHPIANLIDALLAGLERQIDPAPVTREELADALAMSSLGLVTAAKRLLAGSQRSLLVLVDQFEEIFRFRDVNSGADAEENAVECVNLLLTAAAQDDVPIYVLLTMRSDYLGDCARFAGLPEALNDSQFLVPRMAREQLRAAIEGPVAVDRGKITPRLVQRLLHDVDTIAGRGAPDEYDHDQLPVLQHALMRMWEVSTEARARGDAIDIATYENAPVETIHHALDRHAEEVYASLPSDLHRAVARLAFQKLTERDAENREVRKPTPFDDLVAVACGHVPSGQSAQVVVRAVLDAFGGDGRAFLLVNSQQHVDIAHESFIRKWRRLRTWLDEEGQSRRIYLRLAETAARWSERSASLYRGPELAEAERWWKRELPSQAWAKRYRDGFETTARFLARSRRSRRLRVAGAVVAATALVAIALVTTALWSRARVAEADATKERNRAVTAEANVREAIGKLAEAARARGDLEQEKRLREISQQSSDPADARAPLPREAAPELGELRDTAAQSVVQIKTLEDRLKAVNEQLAEARKVKDLPEASARERELIGRLEGTTEQLKTVTADREALRTKLGDLPALQAQLDKALGQLAGGAPLPKGNYRDLYDFGMTAKGRGQWSEAARFLDAAARQRGDTGEPIPMEGRGTMPYLPNYQLGLVLRQLACVEFDRALKARAVQKSTTESQSLFEAQKACAALARQ